MANAAPTSPMPDRPESSEGRGGREGKSLSPRGLRSPTASAGGLSSRCSGRSGRCEAVTGSCSGTSWSCACEGKFLSPFSLPFFLFLASLSRPRSRKISCSGGGRSLFGVRGQSAIVALVGPHAYAIKVKETPKESPRKPTRDRNSDDAPGRARRFRGLSWDRVTVPRKRRRGHPAREGWWEVAEGCVRRLRRELPVASRGRARPSVPWPSPGERAARPGRARRAPQRGHAGVRDRRRRSG